MEELRECPFCGESRVHIEKGEFIDSMHSIECLNPACAVEFNSSSVEELKKRWNTRPTPEAIKDIEWVGECHCEQGVVKIADCQGRNYSETICDLCNGKGTITRQATVGEVREYVVYNLTHDQFPEKVNNGTLRIKR